MKTISANGLPLPVLGMGGWRMGDDLSNERNEITALRRGIELGMNLVDTAEMYGEGNSELLIGRALRGVGRSEYLLVSKVYPHNAGEGNIFISCDASLKRLGTDYLDLYLLHWRGGIPLEETVGCMERLVAAGKIRRWGVSNFDVSDMEELLGIEDKIQQSYSEYNRLIGYINGIEDAHIRQITTLRYVNGLSWQQIAFRIGGGNTSDSVRKTCMRFLLAAN